MGQPTSLHKGRGRGRTVLLVLLSTDFQSLPPLPTSKLGPSGADSRVGGFAYILGPCGSLQPCALLWGWELLPLPQPSQVFSVRGFEDFFSHTGTLGYVVHLTPQLFLPVYLHTNVGPPTPVLQSHCRESSLPWLPISAPPTGLDKCFFFNSLVVKTSIQVDFLLVLVVFLFLNLLLSFWLCEEVQYVYLCLHLGRKFFYLWQRPKYL